MVHDVKLAKMQESSWLGDIMKVWQILEILKARYTSTLPNFNTGGVLRWWLLLLLFALLQTSDGTWSLDLGIIITFNIWTVPQFSSTTSSPNRVEKRRKKSRTCDNWYTIYYIKCWAHFPRCKKCITELVPWCIGVYVCI